MMFEEVRFDFNSQIDVRRSSEFIDTTPLHGLERNLIRLTSDPDFADVADRVRFRIVNMGRVDLQTLPEELHSSSLTTLRALRILLDSISVLPIQQSFDIDYIPGDIDPVRVLRRVVPETQEVGPVKFKVTSDGKLCIARQPAQLNPIDVASVEEAREEITNAGKRLLEYLVRSNCDRRMIESIEILQERIAENANVVRLGLANIGCEIICGSCKDEIPDAVYAMLQAHTLSVNMFVGQFSEWRRFTDQAVSANISKEQAPIFSEAVKKIIDNLKSDNRLAEPNVVQALGIMQKLIADPASVSSKTIFAVWRTLDNLFRAVFGFAAEFLKKTAQDTSELLAKTISKAVVVGLMSAALLGAQSVIPATAALKESEWLKTAVEIVKKQIETVSAAS